jgi:hypothetical protein
MNRRDALKYTGLAFGYTATMGSMAAIMQSCQAEVSGDGWTPKTFSKAQVELVAEFGETLLPKTDTPGAKDVLVHRYLDEYYTRFYTTENKAKQMEMLSTLETHLNEAGGKAFVKLTPEARLEVLNDLNKAALKAAKPSPVMGAYLDLKRKVIDAFFSSEQIGTEVLAYAPVPGPYKGCIPLSDVGKAWAL